MEIRMLPSLEAIPSQGLGSTCGLVLLASPSSIPRLLPAMEALGGEARTPILSPKGWSLATACGPIRGGGAVGFAISQPWA